MNCIPWRGKKKRLQISPKKHSEDFYFNARETIYSRLAELPQGTIKARLISVQKYYYLQRREGKKVLHAYIGKEIPKDLKNKMQERKTLQAELIKIQVILRKSLAASNTRPICRSVV